MLLLAAARANADTLEEVLRNTVRLAITSSGVELSRGVALFLGTHEGKALLLTPAHVLIDPQEIGKKSSPHTLEILLAGSVLRFGYGESALHLKTTSLENAVFNDYLVVEVPVGAEKRGPIFNLTSRHFQRPDRNQPVFIYGVKPQGGYSINPGDMEAIRGKDVVSFEIKTDKVIEQGESGSLILGREFVIHGILSSSDGKNGNGVFPGPELESALETIAWSRDNRQDYRGFSVSLVPTYQYSRATKDLGGGVTRTDTDKGAYTSVEFEYFKVERAAGHASNPKYGFIAGYSDGRAHGLGQADGADYTLKYGGIVGSIDRFSNNSGQAGLFVLSHRVNGKFVHRLGFSFEATTQLSVRSDTAFDAGLRFEINDLSLSGSRGSLGLGLVLRYSWLRAM